MKQIHKKALLLTVLFGNISLSPMLDLVLDRYRQNSLGDSYGYYVNSLKSNYNKKPIYSSSFVPVIGSLRLLRGWIPRPRIRPRPRFRIRPRPRFRIRPNSSQNIRQVPYVLPNSPLNSQQVNRLVSNAMLKSKQQPTMQKLLHEMSSRNQKYLLKKIDYDLTAKIKSRFLLNDVQNLTNQAFIEVELSYKIARDRAEEVLQLNQAINGKLNYQDYLNAKEAAQQTIQELNRYKAIQVLSGATTSVIAIGATASATSRVQSK